MHGVGTVVFTVSAQFGVPVVPYIWSLTRGITSYAREIVASLAEVERRFPRAARASGPVVAVESRRQRVRFGSEADLHAADANVRLVPIADFAGPVRVSVLMRCAQSKDRPSTLILATTTTASSWSLAKTSLELGAKRKLGTGRASLHSQFPRNPRDKIPL